MRIKLENIGELYSTETGEPYVEVRHEWVCAGCRNLVKEEHKYCAECGTSLGETAHIEHHGFGGELLHSDFKKVMNMKHNEAIVYIKSHVQTYSREEKGV